MNEFSIKKIFPSEYLIANLDILGISNQFKSENERERICSLSLLRNFMEEAKNGSEATFGILEPLETICFSDNIVAAYNTKNAQSQEDLINNVHYLILYVLSIQAKAFANSFLLRGAIKFGELYIDKDLNFTCGKGLIETYELESKEAIYPRIITQDDRLLDMIDDIQLSNGFVLKEILKKDNDDKYFLDYLQMFTIANDTEELLKNAKSNYCKYLLKDRCINENIRKKHDWHINYFNKFCERVNLVQYKIEVVDAI